MTTQRERFDINRCTVGGFIQKIWDFEEDIFLRLAFSPGADEKQRYLTLRLPQGMVGGRLVSLQPGMNVSVSGYLADSPYTESLAEFLRDARKNGLLDRLENGDVFRDVRLKRVGTRLDVLELEIQEGEEPRLQSADVQLQGIAARVWEAGLHVMARLAVYDRYTEIMSANGRRGLPRRKPHYITVRFPEGKAGARPVALKKGVRLRLTGRLQIRFYRETLREVLVRSGNAGLVGALNGIVDPDEVSALRDSVLVIAEGAIVLASVQRPAAAPATAAAVVPAPSHSA